MPVGTIQTEGDLRRFIEQATGDLRTRAQALRNRIHEGDGDPNGVVVGSPPDLYLDRQGGAGTTFWIKESGIHTDTGWIAPSTAPPTGTHDLLGVEHPDTVPGAPVKGDLIYGNATPKWDRLAPTTDGFVLTLASGVPVWAAAAAGYSDEQAQDAVGAALTDTATVNLTYNDGANQITADVLDSPTVGGLTPAQLRDGITARAAEVYSNKTLSGTTTIDGVACIAGDRVLLTAQAAPAQNGVYVVAAGAWSRATDMDTVGELALGTTVKVTEGTNLQGTLWQIVTAPAVLGTDPINFDQVNRLDFQNGLRVVNFSYQTVEAFAKDSTIDIVGGPTGGFRVGAGSLTDAHISPTADIDSSKILDFTTVVRGSISVSDTATLDLSYAAGVISGAVLDSPTLQGQNSAYHLSRANHTGTQLAATISDFSTAADARIAAKIGVTVQAWDTDLDTWATKTAPSGVVVGTTDSQTLTNKTLTTPTIASFTNATHTHQNAAGGGTLDHGLALTGLSDDDHTQYALLAGRSGGQTLIGGTGAAEDLTLKATSSGSNTGLIAIDRTGMSGSSALLGLSYQMPTTLTAAHTAMAVGLNTSALASQTVAMNTGGGVRALQLGGTFNVTGEPAAQSFLVFNFGPTINLKDTGTGVPGTQSDINGMRIYNSAFTVNLDNAVNYGAVSSTSAGDHIAIFRSAGVWTAATGGALGTVGSLTPFHAAPMTVGTGWTITNSRILYSEVPTGSGTITNPVIIDIDDWATSTVTMTNAPISYRSTGPTTSLRHGGPSIFGTTGAPATGLTIDCAGSMSHRAQTISPAAATTVNDQAITNSFVRLTPAGAGAIITGFAGGVDGRILTITNADTTNTVQLNNEDAGSAAANRVRFKSGANVTLAAASATASGGSVRLMYDATTSRWREV